LSELTHPLAAHPSRAHADDQTATRARVSRAPSFTELVYAQFAWWRELQEGAGHREAAEAYGNELARFELRHGEVASAFWCSHVESGACLTEKKRALPWMTPVSTFHRESDWATQHAPDIARELHRCDEIAVRARIVLKGVRRRICLRLVMASAAHLLSLVDGRAAHTDEAKTGPALVEEREALDATEKYYCQAANGQAQIVYFTGMVVVAALISIVAGLFLTFGSASPVYAALIAGAAGAVVSVIQRINAGQFDLEYDVGWPYAFFLGGLRPLIGGSFALAIAFAFKSGVLHLPLAPGTDAAKNAGEEHFALVVIGFLAGFSERFAQDTLAAVAQTAIPPKTPPAAGKPNKK
jgi:hypothetical protein